MVNNEQVEFGGMQCAKTVQPKGWNKHKRGHFL